MLLCNSSTREKGQGNPSISLDSQSGQASEQRLGEEKLSENKQIDGQTDRQLVRQIDKWMDGQTGRQTDRQIDRQIDWWKSIEEYTHVSNPDLYPYMHIGMYTTLPYKESKNSGTTGKKHPFSKSVKTALTQYQES